jgi:hypothetical protein
MSGIRVANVRCWGLGIDSGHIVLFYTGHMFRFPFGKCREIHVIATAARHFDVVHGGELFDCPSNRPLVNFEAVRDRLLARKGASTLSVSATEDFPSDQAGSDR